MARTRSAARLAVLSCLPDDLLQRILRKLRRPDLLSVRAASASLARNDPFLGGKKPDGPLAWGRPQSVVGETRNWVTAADFSGLRESSLSHGSVLVGLGSGAIKELTFRASQRSRWTRCPRHAFASPGGVAVARLASVSLSRRVDAGFGVMTRKCSTSHRNPSWRGLVCWPVDAPVAAHWQPSTRHSRHGHLNPHVRGQDDRRR